MKENVFLHSVSVVAWLNALHWMAWIEESHLYMNILYREILNVFCVLSEKLESYSSEIIEGY